MSEPTWGEMPALLYAGIDGFLERPGRRRRGRRARSPPRRRSDSAARRRVRLTRSAAGDPRGRGGGDGRASRSARTPTSTRRARFPALRAAVFEAGGRLDGRRGARRAGRRAPPAARRAHRDRGARGGRRLRCATPCGSGRQRRAGFAGAPLISPATLYPHRVAARATRSSRAPPPGAAVRPVRCGSCSSRRDFASLLPGEVLVCPYTNPSWTPLFERAVAVVVDTGGLASHAAIVAREYGIPAVMGTGVGHPGAARRRRRHRRRGCRARRLGPEQADDDRSSREARGAEAPRSRRRSSPPRSPNSIASGYAAREHGCGGRRARG